jgi:hypothetical protein
MKYIQVIIVGVSVGAISWVLSGLLATQFEPFDSAIGFLANQIILCLLAAYYGYKKGFMVLSAYLFSACIGMNAYVYLLGDSEKKAWILLYLITSIIFLVMPFILGLVAKGVCVWKRGNSLNESF